MLVIILMFGCGIPLLIIYGGLGLYELYCKFFPPKTMRQKNIDVYMPAILITFVGILVILFAVSTVFQG